MIYKCWKHSGCPFIEGHKGLNKRFKCLIEGYSVEQCKKDNFIMELDWQSEPECEAYKISQENWNKLQKQREEKLIKS